MGIPWGRRAPRFWHEACEAQGWVWVSPGIRTVRQALVVGETRGSAGWPPAGRAMVWEDAHLSGLVGALLVQALGCRTTHSNQEVLRSCSLIFLATKPHVLPAVLAEVAPVVTSQHILVSVVAGVTLSTLQEVSGCWAAAGLRP